MLRGFTQNDSIYANMNMKKNKHYFLLNLDLEGRKCLVIGGDDEALEKTERLMECDAVITLVSPNILPEIKKLAGNGKIKHIHRKYESGDEEGMYFVLNCVKTDTEMSDLLFNNCVRQHILISSYDQSQYSTATMAALVRAGDKVRISISTGNTSPAVARKLRMELEKLLDEKFARFVDWIVAYREELEAKGIPPAERKKFFREFMKDFQIDGKCVYPEKFEHDNRPE